MQPQSMLHGHVMAYHSYPGCTAACPMIALAAITLRLAISAGERSPIVAAAVAAATPAAGLLVRGR